MARARIHPDALLCEGCGYEIAGLFEQDPAGACPECGRALAASMPGHRPGSPFQRAPRAGAGVLLQTWWHVIRRPRGVWEEVRGADSGELASRMRTLRLWTNAAAVLGVIVLLAAMAMLGAKIGPSAWRGLLPMTLGALLLLEVLCRIESIGVRLIGRQRGWRVTPGIARAVIAHASVGWVLAGVLFTGGTWLARWSQGFVRDGGRPRAGDWLTPLLEAAPVLLPAGGFLIGLVAFEAMVYVGVRRMRFVNRERDRDEPDAEIST